MNQKPATSSFDTFVVKTLCTFFYVGYLPLIPGTFGSLAGLLVYKVFEISLFAQIVVCFSLIVLGFCFAGKAEELFQRKDASVIVIDEVAGMMICLLAVPANPTIIAAGFLLFRLLDTLKPYPAGRLQSLHGSAGVMADDIVAAIYTNCILQIITRLPS